MASVSSFEVDGMIRGFHVYKEVSEPNIGEELQCILDESNLHDPFAVAVIKNDKTVGHLPRKISSSSSLFLRRQGVISCVVSGLRRYSRLVRFSMVYVAAESEKSNEADVSATERMSIEEPDSSKEVVSKEVYQPVSSEWVKFGVMVLSFKERDIIVKGEELNDIHLTFAQKILAAQFPNIVGLQATNYQSRRPLQTTEVEDLLHVNNNHWVVITTYDSSRRTENNYMIH